MGILNEKPQVVCCSCGVDGDSEINGVRPMGGGVFSCRIYCQECLKLVFFPDEIWDPEKTLGENGRKWMFTTRDVDFDRNEN